MRIGVDARFLVEERTGVETYFLRILEELIRIGGPEEYLLYRGEGISPRLPEGRWRCADGVSRGGWRLGSRLRRDGVELFYSPVTAFPLTGSARRICTVHDLAWHYVPGSYGALDRFRQRRWTALAAARADRIIVVSESTRRDLAALHPAAAGKLVVIPPGVGESFFEPPGRNEVDRVRKRYSLDGRYLIAVSGFHPRKNLPNLVKAYDRFRDGSPERVPLVIAGRGGGDSARLGRRILESPHRRDIILTGYVPQEDLRPLYAGADLMVFPSRFEGFGIPALEAMACGTPVLVSDLPVFREVCGEAALRVDPADPGSIAGGITLSLRGDPERSGRIACGIERARTYRWAESARRLREVFHETAGGGA